MYLFDLQTKLKKINPNLVVFTDKGIALGEIRSYPLVLMFGKRHRGFSALGKHYMDANTQKYMEMKENGQNGEYICGVSAWTPEFDMLNERGEVVARGYRSLGKLLAEKGIASWDKIRKVFRASDLGRTDYDRATYEQKLEWARKEKR